MTSNMQSSRSIHIYIYICTYLPYIYIEREKERALSAKHVIKVMYDEQGVSIEWRCKAMPFVSLN